jgi:hypothetical protein
MPNWTENVLKIRPSEKLNKNQEDMLKEIVKKYTSIPEDTEFGSSDEELRVLDFEKISPRPATEEWYSWNNKNWGTKWSANAVGFNQCTDLLEFYFDTAWSPPEPIIAKLASLYPKLNFNFKYAEPGMCFAGKQVFRNGRRMTNHFTEDSKDKLFKEFGMNFEEEEIIEETKE